MKSSTKVLLWVSGAVVGALTLLGIVEEAKAAPSSVTTTLTPGHRYQLVAVCPFTLPSIGGSTPAQLLGLPDVSNVTLSLNGNVATFVFDYTGAAMTLPPIQMGGGTACTTTLNDLGVSPTSSGAPGGHVNAVSQTPQIVVQVGGSYQTAPVAQGAVVVTAPAGSRILSVGPGQALAHWTAGNTKNIANLVLSGAPGNITVLWAPPAPLLGNKSASIRVS